MANLAQQLKEELTQKAREDELYKSRLLEWVMNQFRAGQNPVKIHCTEYAKSLYELSKMYEHLLPNGKGSFDFAKIKRDDNGRFILTIDVEYNPEIKRLTIDVTDTELAMKYAPNGVDEQAKRLFLESEGFMVHKCWHYGEGDSLEIYY